MFSVHDVSLGTDSAGLGSSSCAVAGARLVTRGAQQLGLISEALVESLAALVTHLATVLTVALTLPIPLPGASSLALTIATAHSPIVPQHAALSAVWTIVVSWTTHSQPLHTQPLSQLRSGVRVQSPPGLDVLLPLPGIHMTLRLASTNILAQLLRDLCQPHLNNIHCLLDHQP